MHFSSLPYTLDLGANIKLALTYILERLSDLKFQRSRPNSAFHFTFKLLTSLLCCQSGPGTSQKPSHGIPASRHFQRDPYHHWVLYDWAGSYGPPCSSNSWILPQNIYGQITAHNIVTSELIFPSISFFWIVDFKSAESSFIASHHSLFLTYHT